MSEQSSGVLPHLDEFILPPLFPLGLEESEYSLLNSWRDQVVHFGLNFVSDVAYAKSGSTWSTFRDQLGQWLNSKEVQNYHKIKEERESLSELLRSGGDNYTSIVHQYVSIMKKSYGEDSKIARQATAYEKAIGSEAKTGEKKKDKKTILKAYREFVKEYSQVITDPKTKGDLETLSRFCKNPKACNESYVRYVSGYFDSFKTKGVKEQDDKDCAESVINIMEEFTETQRKRACNVGVPPKAKGSKSGAGQPKQDGMQVMCQALQMSNSQSMQLGAASEKDFNGRGILEKIFEENVENCPKPADSDICQPKGAGGHAGALMTVVVGGNTVCAKKIDAGDLPALEMACHEGYRKIFEPDFAPSYSGVCKDQEGEYRLLMTLASSGLVKPKGIDVKIGTKTYNEAVLSRKIPDKKKRDKKIEKMKKIDSSNLLGSTSSRKGYRVEGTPGMKKSILPKNIAKLSLKKGFANPLKELIGKSASRKKCIESKLYKLQERIESNRDAFHLLRLAGASLLIFVGEKEDDCQVRLIDLSNSDYVTQKDSSDNNEYENGFKMGLTHLIRDVGKVKVETK